MKSTLALSIFGLATTLAAIASDGALIYLCLPIFIMLIGVAAHGVTR